jgi:hypothetical protein
MEFKSYNQRHLAQIEPTCESLGIILPIGKSMMTLREVI